VIEAVEGLLEHGDLLGGKIFILVKIKKFLSGNPLELEGSQVLTTLLMLLLFLGCTCL